MSGSYRIELSPNNRAGCRNKKCKDDGVKIFKGQLRLGTFVVTQDFQSFHYKHWGCVTPKVLQNINGSIEGNYDLLDGYEDLPEADQEKVRKALEVGHVDDEDFNGDIEMNREGKNGMRTPASKKKLKQEKAERESEAAVASASPDESEPKKRSRIKPDPDANAEEPAAKKAKVASKKGARVKAEKDSSDSEANTKPKKTARKKATNVKVEARADDIIKPEGSDNDTSRSPPVKQSRASKKAAPKTKTVEAGETSRLIDGQEAPAYSKQTNGNSEAEGMGSELESEANGNEFGTTKGRKNHTKGATSKGATAASKNEHQATSSTNVEKPKRANGRVTRAHPGLSTS